MQFFVLAKKASNLQVLMAQEIECIQKERLDTTVFLGNLVKGWIGL